VLIFYVTNIFMLQAFAFHVITCCVTHFNVQIINEQSVQVCDATET